MGMLSMISTISISVFFCNTTASGANCPTCSHFGSFFVFVFSYGPPPHIYVI